MPRLSFPMSLERPFQLWSFEVSHGVLLLRSNITYGVSNPRHTTRVDLMFRAVRELRLPNQMESLSIDILAPDDDRIDALGITSKEGCIFSLSSESFPVGYVVAGGLYLSEDDLSYGEASTIDNTPLEGHVVKSGWYPS